MYVLKNAFSNILRNKGRNLLIGAIIFAIIITTVIALMISNTSKLIIDDYKSRFSSEVMLQPNMDKVRQDAMSNSTNGLVKMVTPTLSADQYISYGESDYLAQTSYTASAGVICDEITSVAAELGGGTGMMRMLAGPDSTESQEENEPLQFMMSLQGNKVTDFDSGLRELASGRMPTDLNECIVSTDLAELNGIQIGDEFTFTGELSEMGGTASARTSYTLTVVGTYYDITDEYGTSMQQNAYTNRRNEIVTTYETVAQQFIPGMNGGIRINATYYLKSPDLLEAFTAELRTKGLSEVFDVSTDEASYEKIVGPVEGLKSIAVTFMIVVLIFGGIIIALLSSIAIRERKYEIGVLRAMGMKKHTVATGLWFEMLIITVICLFLGLGIGSITAQPITNTLLKGQVEAAEAASSQTQTSGGMMMGMPMLSNPSANVQPLDEINVSLGFTSALQISAIALFLASFAALISIMRITGYEPIKILMERN